MGQAVVTFRVMPESPEVDLEALKSFAKEQVESFCDPDELKVNEEDVAFGLKAIVLQFVMDEDEGDTGDLEATISDHDDVKNAETTDVRRAFG